MKKLKKSSVSLAWLARAKSAAAPAPARATGDRLDLVLPRGWPDSGSPVFWRWRRRGDKPQSGQATDLRQMPEAARNARAYVWTPAGDTVLTSATLPTRSARKIAQALPFALEDRLLGDPETLHFAYRAESDGSLSVAVTAHERLRHWTDALAQAGIKPVTLCPATLLVPWALDCWSLAFAEDEVLVRTGSASGFVTPLTQATPPPLLAAALQEAVRSQKTPEYLVVFSAPAGFPAEAWGAQLQVPVRVETASVWEKQEEPSAPLNLLQGQFEQKGQLKSSLRPYFPAAAMLLVWMLGNMAVDITDWWKLRQQHQAYTREMTSLLLSSFPETKTVLDPAAQMQRSIDTLLARTGNRDRDLLPMLAKTATALRADPRVRLRGVRYADQSLTLELTWPAAGSPDAVKAALEAAGLRTEVLALTPRAGEVDGRLRLQPATARPATSPSTGLRTGSPS
ncbi:MAG TPA: type II secretion system protein GspL [Acidiferrobacterales bacterium]|nr:type II secretion system protein GspL [Acidiferrobacterales bacterium]